MVPLRRRLRHRVPQHPLLLPRPPHRRPRRVRVLQATREEEWGDLADRGGERVRVGRGRGERVGVGVEDGGGGRGELLGVCAWGVWGVSCGVEGLLEV